MTFHNIFQVMLDFERNKDDVIDGKKEPVQT
jgi:hypothetical protein